MKVQDIVANMLTGRKAQTPSSSKPSTGFSSIMDNAGKKDVVPTAKKQSYGKQADSTPKAVSVKTSSARPMKEMQQPSMEPAEEVLSEAEELLSGTEELFGEEEAFAEVEELVGNAMMEILTEDLQVSEEELTQAMEILGLSCMDLFQPEHLKQLVMQLQGASDITEVLMNDDLSTMLTQVLGDLTVENIAQETGIPEQEIGQMVLKAMPEQTEEVSAPVVVQESAVAEEAVTVQALQENGQPEAANTKIAATAEEQEKTSTEPEKGQDSLPEVSVVKTVSEGKGSLSKENFGQDMQKQPDLAENMVNNIVSSAVTETVSADGTVTMTTVEIRQVVVQIVQQIKVVINPEQTDMHMTLHPEHLGRLQLAVTSRDGIMTANFVVQNEMVRHALETQMQELKDTFAEQGLKVEAVEVTVSTFEFTQDDQAGAGGQQPEQKKQKGRAINMENAFLEEVDLKESEGRAAAMISGSGNNVNYIA